MREITQMAGPGKPLELSCATTPIGVTITRTREVATPGEAKHWEYGVEC
jgi:hypothetical protein